MDERVEHAILTAYAKTKPHLVDGLSDALPIQMLVVFRLGDLKELERSRLRENTTILSGG